MLLLSIASFELTKRVRMLSTWVYFGIFFSAGVFMMLANGGAFESFSVSMGSDKVMANAPFSLNGLIALLSYVAVLVTAPVFGQAVHQDVESGIHPIFFTQPTGKGSYLLGRFLGSLLVMAFILAAAPIGLWLGSFAPFLDRSLFEPNRLFYYLWPWLILAVPNLLATGSIFFALATLTRRMMPVYVGAVVLFIGYNVGLNMMVQMDMRTVGAFLDPFGILPCDLLTRYWTVAEKNSMVVPLSGIVLANRAAWMGIGGLLLAFTGWRFQFSVADRSRGKEKASQTPEAEPSGPLNLPTVHPVPARGRALLGLAATSFRLNFLEVVRSVYFICIVIAGLLFLVQADHFGGEIFGTRVWPVTSHLIGIVSGTFGLFMAIVITVYSGELVWGERDVGVDQLLDAAPVPTWVPFLTKLLALMAVQVVMMAVVLVAGLVLQAVHFRGHFPWYEPGHYQLGLWIRDLFGIRLIDYWLLCLLAFAIQSIVQHKYLGHALMVVYFFSPLVLDRLGLENHLYRYGENPGLVYSDMNGFGPFLKPLFWFDAYWALFALLLAVASSLFWMRGTDGSWRVRRALARARFGWKMRLTALAILAGFASTGGYIWWNIAIRNLYRTAHDRERFQAEYEKTYKAIEGTPQPKIEDVKVRFEIRPETREVRMVGSFQIHNRSMNPISKIWVELPEEAHIVTMTAASATHTDERDREHGVVIFKMPPGKEMQAGDRAILSFDLIYPARGFHNANEPTDVAGNGTFLNDQALPHIGYDPARELIEDGTRRKYGLAPRDRMPDVNDAAGMARNYITPDADWISYEATVCTSPDQVAVAPGYLDHQWSSSAGNCFLYKMDSPILDFFSVLSARYTLRHDQWTPAAGGEPVDLSIYYQPGHEFDLEAMMSGMKDSLDYYTSHFGPYQHRQVRILEFPRYQTFAQSFPNTIPFSEGIGFIAKVDPESNEDLDYPYYVTAHEVAHQWWGHQVVGGYNQGSTMLSETLAQYSALMVMKGKFGDAKMRRFLHYELDEYLTGRGLERKKEVPLDRVEDQPYIHYRKGSLAMFALQDYLGDEVVNRVLHDFVHDWGGKGPPYPNSLDLVRRFRAVTPPELAYLIDDLFDNITLYDNRALSATWSTRPDGKIEVRMKVSARKYHAGELGEEKDQPVHDLIEVGAVDDNNEPLVVEKRWLDGGESEVVLVMDKVPAKAGIDPRNVLVDRRPEDNLVEVQKAGRAGAGGST